MSLVAGMAAGADSIDYMGMPRHGATDVLFAGMQAPSTLGTGQEELFPLDRYDALITDSAVPLVEAESTHRGHAFVEQVFAHLKASALAHLPSGRFNANAAWLACAAIAFNLTRARGVLAGGALPKAETATIRARIINIPARVARSARRITLNLPRGWLWATSWLSAWHPRADRSRAAPTLAPEHEGKPNTETETACRLGGPACSGHCFSCDYAAFFWFR